ncbi:MAG TPA: DUF202 domain-containing protein [Leptolyngbyaceae cyanobacterium M33_DOE_097]|uniref:DUF202 domain-containing protein n=1 Tax=Oscillatoriales cyanobacterium SpSt-418 TaxID=2282169 RepID=A0A7C3PEB7_9CYAN|nr:DUF202 domain-containing protein [Leptolyngbyaceae cyanobacterium M33_DOE_097]
MHPRDFPEKAPYNLNNELAKERTRAAADRTLMAWIRTSLSLIGFGFGIPTIVRTIEMSQSPPNANPRYFSNIVGLSFISIGMYAMFIALNEHRQILKKIRSDRYVYESSGTATQVGLALLVVGFISFIGVLIRSLTS